MDEIQILITAVASLITIPLTTLITIYIKWRFNHKKVKYIHSIGMDELNPKSEKVIGDFSKKIDSNYKPTFTGTAMLDINKTSVDRVNNTDYYIVIYERDMTLDIINVYWVKREDVKYKAWKFSK